MKCQFKDFLVIIATRFTSFQITYYVFWECSPHSYPYRFKFVCIKSLEISHRNCPWSIHLATQIFLEQTGHFIAKQCNYILANELWWLSIIPLLMIYHNQVSNNCTCTCMHSFMHPATLAFLWLAQWNKIHNFEKNIYVQWPWLYNHDIMTNRQYA